MRDILTYCYPEPCAFVCKRWQRYFTKGYLESILERDDLEEFLKYEREHYIEDYYKILGDIRQKIIHYLLQKRKICSKEKILNAVLPSGNLELIIYLRTRDVVVRRNEYHITYLALSHLENIIVNNADFWNENHLVKAVESKNIDLVSLLLAERKFVGKLATIKATKIFAYDILKFLVNNDCALSEKSFDLLVQRKDRDMLNWWLQDPRRPVCFSKVVELCDYETLKKLKLDSSSLQYLSRIRNLEERENMLNYFHDNCEINEDFVIDYIRHIGLLREVKKLLEKVDYSEIMLKTAFISKRSSVIKYLINYRDNLIMQNKRKIVRR